MFDTYRAFGIAQGGELLEWRPLAALELYRSDGPFDNGENNRRYSVYTHAQRAVGEATTIKVAATSYMGAWNGSGQLPLRAVQAGQLDRFDAVDPSEGGESQRHSVYAKLRAYPSEDSELSALAYIVRYHFNLFSNFTFFSTNPVDGDQIEQEDDRWYAGFSGDYRFTNNVGKSSFVTTVGGQGRGDAVATGLWDAVQRQRGMSRVDADVRQASVGAFVQEDVAWTRWFRSLAGLRLDYFAFQVDDLGDSSGSEGSSSRCRAPSPP